MFLNHIALKLLSEHEFILPGASTEANVFYDLDAYGSADYLHDFLNSTVKGSKGYGIVKGVGTVDYDFKAVDRNNVFSDNTLGDIFQE